MLLTCCVLRTSELADRSRHSSGAHLGERAFAADALHVRNPDPDAASGRCCHITLSILTSNLQLFCQAYAYC